MMLPRPEPVPPPKYRTWWDGPDRILCDTLPDFDPRHHGIWQRVEAGFRHISVRLL